ncbi:hypothetical protein CEY16_04450 [Halalkalibacillus sediminis]|uniref:DUF4190 domain-containing protein n=1 Tax=Halalkalibacillus sediminis TaxID=2018042 RepID=A0A2I0QXF9_9BACI|nr:hypothetical protein [Halalkalibacillus sediminis]PKR79005.1 hypothetical protein CEY16_04450 [Halalkalibacillus sediminis]
MTSKDDQYNEEQYNKETVKEANQIDQQHVLDPLDAEKPLAQVTPNEYAARDRGEDVEFASESAAFNPNELDSDKLRKEEKETRMEQHVDAGWGWIALVMSLLAFFVWTFLFGVVGAIIGVYAKRRGANTLGNLAIGFALVAIAVRLFVYPLI